MHAANLYTQLGQLLATMPALHTTDYASPDGQRWLGRASALIEASGDVLETARFRLAAESLGGPGHAGRVSTIKAILYHALARAELKAPASAQGSFIPVSESFTAIAALSKILGTATASVMFVDPYADANLLTDFALLAAEGLAVKVLADAGQHKPGLKPTAANWVKQYGGKRPLEVRLAPARTLHDRLVLIDGREVWTVGQSFNALASRSPTSVIRVDIETAKMKIESYDATWAAATSLI